MALKEEDVLLHYGIRGMHWGTRKGRAIARDVHKSEGYGVRTAIKSVGRSVGNTVRHPFVSTGVRAKNAIQHPLLTSTSPITMRAKNNQDIRKEVANIKNLKARVKNEKAQAKSLKIARKQAIAEGNSSKAKKLSDQIETLNRGGVTRTGDFKMQKNLQKSQQKAMKAKAKSDREKIKAAYKKYKASQK